MEEYFEPTSLDDLILSGAVEVASIDEDGNFMYSLTDKASEIARKLIDNAMNRLYEELKDLWVLGYINMDIDSVNPTITLTEKALNPAEVEKLNNRLINSLTFIIKALRIK